jgi:hypothetical protein
MKKPSRYDTSTLIEAQFEPGSRGRVLKNLLGIKSKREMDRVVQETGGAQISTNFYVPNESG